jgi:hypothetical protein
MNTIQLSPSTSLMTWDLVIDSNGNIATTTGPDALAQDVASAISTFLGEAYYDTTMGIQYLTDVLGQPFSPSVLKALLVQAALTVPGVVSAKATLAPMPGRTIGGTVEFIDINGQALGVTF